MAVPSCFSNVLCEILSVGAEKCFCPRGILYQRACRPMSAVYYMAVQNKLRMVNAGAAFTYPSSVGCEEEQ